jgi:tetratricopeptide (TPR) repeat protein
MKLFLSILFGLILAYFLGRPALSWTFAKDNPELAMRFDDEGSRLLSLKNRKALENVSDATVQTELAARAKMILKRDPLSDTAILHHGFIAFENQNFEKAETLFKAAQSRNPRSRGAALGLYNIALRKEETTKALELFNVYLSLEPETFQQQLPVLLALSEFPVMWPAFEKIFEKDLFWASDFYNALVQKEGKNPQLSARLAKMAAGASNYAMSGEQTQRILYANLLTLQDYKKARDVWRDIQSSQGKAAPVIYDASFQGLEGPLPFNWQIYSSANGYSEFEREGGLILSGAGNSNGIFLTQQFIGAPAGQSYRLSITAEGRLTKNNGPFAARIACALADRQLSVLSINEAGEEEQVYTQDFTIPEEGCDTQKIQFFANQGAFPARAEIILKSISLRPIAALKE